MSKKLFLTRRSLFLACAIALTGLGLVFKGPLFHFALKSYVSHKLALKGKWDFDYSYISFEDHGVAFNDIELYSAKKDISAHISKIFCRAPNIKQISFSNHFVVEGLNIKFEEKAVKKPSSNKTHKNTVLSSLQQVEIKSGTITIPGDTVNFSLGKSISPQKLGKLIISKEGHGLVACDISSWADRLVVDVEASQSELSFYKKFADFFLGEKSSLWKIEKGRLDGRAFLSFSENQVKDVRLHMNLLDTKFRNEKQGILAGFDRIFVDLDYPLSNENRSMIENVKVNSSVDKGSITVYDEKGQSRFSFKDISGFVSASAFKEAAVELSGFVDDKERLLPVKLVGKPAKKDRDGLELDLSLELDPVFGEKAGVNLICVRQEEDFLLRTTCEKLKEHQMIMMQIALGLLNPTFKDFTLSGGTYSGEVEVLFNKKGVKDFSLKNLACDDLNIYSEKYDARIEASHVSGELAIDLFSEKKTKITDWKALLNKGSIIVGQEGRLPLHLENIEVKASLEDGVFVDTSIKGSCRGIEGQAAVEGSFESPTINFDARSKGDDFLKCFHQKETNYETDVILSSVLEVKENHYEGRGILSLIDKDDETEINFNAQTANFKDIDLRFDTEKISGAFYPFINEILNFKWSVDGLFNIQGRYNNEKLTMEFSGEDVTYREKHSFIKEAKGSAYLINDFKDGSFALDVFLSEGHKKVIAGKNLFVDQAHLRISSDDTYLKVRDFYGKLQTDELGMNVFVKGNKFDLDSSGGCRFDLYLDSDHLELCRFEGGYIDQKVHLGDLSHILDAPVDLKVGDFSEQIKLEVNSALNFNQVPFPKMVRDRDFGEVKCQIEINNDHYMLSLNDKQIALSGDMEKFKLKVGEILLNGQIYDDKVEINGGRFNIDKHQVMIDTLSFAGKNALFKGKVLSDDVKFDGEVCASFDGGLTFNGKGKAEGQLKEYGNLKFVTDRDFTFEYDEKGVVRDLNLVVSDTSDQISSVFVKSLIVKDKGDKITLHGVYGTAKKSFVEVLVGKRFLDDDITFSAEADYTFSEKDFWVSGDIKSQNILVGKSSLEAKNIHVRGNKKSLVVDWTTPLYGTDIDLSAHMYFDNHKPFQIEGSYNLNRVLEIGGAYGDKFEIYRMKGHLCGVNFEMVPDETLKESLFKLELGLDLQKMKSFMPSGVSEFVDQIGLGSGIEVVGELDIKNEKRFKGVIKGTDFDFLQKYSLGSLFGNLEVKDGVITLTDFAIADRALMASIPLATFDLRKKGCQLQAKKVELTNLRPSLISKKGERKKLRNPFMLEKVEITDLHGDLAHINTLKGKGIAHFLNSFDRQKNMVYEFGKEIIGRIGLDPVLMIPVEGYLDFTVGDGKLNFIKLYDTFSDKKRSYFYLYNKTPSYLDFDGNIHIDIRMKQYGLLKLTELFIISLDGPLSKPKISLK